MTKDQVGKLFQSFTQADSSTTRKYGGSGLGYHEYIAIIEEISKVDPSIGLSVAAHNSLCTGHIYYFGNEAQKLKPNQKKKHKATPQIKTKQNRRTQPCKYNKNTIMAKYNNKIIKKK